MRALILAAGLACAAVPAVAQAPCGPYDAIVDVLTGQHGEASVLRMMADAGFVLEIWINAQTETWTVLMVRPDGTACLPAYGTGVMSDRLIPSRAEAL